jgi:hypothetical protein
MKKIFLFTSALAKLIPETYTVSPTCAGFNADPPGLNVIFGFTVSEA